MIDMDGLRPSTVGDVLYQTFRLTSIDTCAEHPGRFLSVPACAAGSGDVPPFHTGSNLHALLPREAFLRWALPCFSAGTPHHTCGGTPQRASAENQRSVSRGKEPEQRNERASGVWRKRTICSLRRRDSRAPTEHRAADRAGICAASREFCPTCPPYPSVKQENAG